MEPEAIELEYGGDATPHDPRFDMFCAAFAVYVADLKAHQRWLVWPQGAEAEDRGGAWRDFRGSRTQFNFLCGLTGVDPDAARDALRKSLAAVCEGGVQ